MDISYEKWLFPKNLLEAKQAQQEMAQKVSVNNELENKPIIHIAGMDVSNTPFDPDRLIYGAVVVVSYPSLTVVETATKIEKQPFPYIPGLLGFREVPTLIHAYRQLSIRPDLVMVDGHGVSHPRGLGVASHVGVLLDIPTIGVAKSILVGSPKEPLAETVGSRAPLLWQGKEIGRMLRSRKNSSPLIVSIGHKITLEIATQFVLCCLKGYRLPEPTRQAHLMANKCRKIDMGRGGERHHR